jgi:predicted RNase H-like HicB family nuclease
MKNVTAIVEQDLETGYFMGYVSGITGAHSQGRTLDELRANLTEVLEMLAEEGELNPESKFVGTQQFELAK